MAFLPGSRKRRLVPHMKITNPSRLPGRQFRRPVLFGLLLASLVAVGSAAHAGILRDVLAKVGIGADKPPVNANGDAVVFPPGQSFIEALVIGNEPLPLFDVFRFEKRREW